MTEQDNLGNPSQSMVNTLASVTFGDGVNNFTFAPQQIIQISPDKIKLETLIPISPYMGLKPFEGNEFDTQLFFGRDQLILRLMQTLTERNLVLLLGASGSGKSSVIKAGLIPKLRKSLGTRFCELAFKPQNDPFLSLFISLATKIGDQTKAAIALSGQPETLTQIVTTLKRSEDYWLIYIDQFEEFFTSSEPEKRDRFIQGLGQLYQFLHSSQNQSVKIVMTMRADFLDRFDPFPMLGEIVRGNIELITTMYEDELRQAIEQPAAKHGVIFEGGLVKTIIDDIKGQVGSLPLLQYTLGLLWKQDNIADPNDPTKPHPHTDRTLNNATYTTLGGVRGALQTHVEEVYSEKLESSAQQEAAKQIFLKLIQWVPGEGGQFIPVSKRRLYSAFQAEIEVETLKVFIQERLIVSSSGNLNQEVLESNLTTSQQATVEIAHEILLSAWERLKGWIEESKDVLVAKSQLQADMARYAAVFKKDVTKSNDELLTGSRLERLLEFQNGGLFKLRNLPLTEEETEFLAKSVEWRDRKSNTAKGQILLIQAEQVYKDDPLLGLRLCLEGWSLIHESDKTVRISIEDTIKEKMKSGHLLKLGNDVEEIIRFPSTRFFYCIRSNKSSEIRRIDTTEVAEILTEKIVSLDRLIGNHESFPFSLISYNNGLQEVRFISNYSLLFRPEKRIECIGYSYKKGSPFFMVRYSDQSYELRAIDTGKLVIRLSGKVHIAIHFLVGSRYFLVPYEDKPAELRLMEDGTVIEQLSGEFKFDSLVLSPDKTHFLIKEKSRIELRRMTDNKTVLPSESQQVRNLTFIKDSPFFVVDYSHNEDSPTELHRTDSDQVVVLSGEGGAYNIDAWFSESHFTIKYSNAQMELRRKDTGGKEILTSIKVKDIRFMPNSTYFVVCYEDAPSEIRRTDNTEAIVLSGKFRSFGFGSDPSHYYMMGNETEYILSDSKVICSRDGQIVCEASSFYFFERVPFLFVNPSYSSEDSRSILFRTDTGDKIILNAEISSMSRDDSDNLTFSPDGKTFVITRSKDSSAEFCVAHGGTVIWSVPHTVEKAIFSPNSDWVIVKYRNYEFLRLPELRQLSNGTVIKQLTAQVSYQGVTFSPNTTSFVIFCETPRDYVLPFGSNEFCELRRTADGELFVAAKKISYLGNGDFCIVEHSNNQSELWHGQDNIYRLTELGLGLKGHLLDEVNNRLIVYYNDGTAYLLDLNWLIAMKGNPSNLSGEELVKVVFLAFENNLFDENKLKNHQLNSSLKLRFTPRSFVAEENLEDEAK